LVNFDATMTCIIMLPFAAMLVAWLVSKSGDEY